jgi:DNA-binding transcriptional LysR family regulator
VAKTLYEEDFVIAMRAGHPFADDPTLEHYCRMQHVVVSLTGDAHGFVDEALAKLGRARRIALAVPNFMLALALIAETDLICALPRRFVEIHRRRFGVTSTDAPLRLPDYRICAIAPKVAMMDARRRLTGSTAGEGQGRPDTAGKRRRRNGRPERDRDETAAC